MAPPAFSTPPAAHPLLAQLSEAREALTRGVLVRNEFGETQEVHIPAERPLTL